MSASNTQKHFVLVHGAGHGAWCWYKIKPRLESAGHKVTALNNAASGIDTKSLEDVHSLGEYSEPLLQFIGSLGPQEKVILVGHSLGGMNLSVAMEKFPEKISAAVFLAAFLPDTTHHPGYVVDQFMQKLPLDRWLDTQFGQFGEEPFASFHFGPKFLATSLYQLSPIEDIELAKSLVRKSSFFREQVCKMKNFSNEGYGSVTRVYAICEKDMVITKEFQHWMIQNSGVKDVVEIKGADHMPMFSKPQELSNSLLEIAQKYT
ncbi:salicylic acid-binding protein 2-like [Rosa rugosa]|uniref:salicylic acid-binding protein 2-like n=1 Tax=Rosa rugosa TaxID=74645 RepID=UPI002B41353B|nr:salicylic acid-binding protein 2-like [Rosa rugosa]